MGTAKEFQELAKSLKSMDDLKASDSVDLADGTKAEFDGQNILLPISDFGKQILGIE